jgi:hypothetical protein
VRPRAKRCHLQSRRTVPPETQVRAVVGQHRRFASRPLCFSQALARAVPLTTESGSAVPGAVPVAIMAMAIGNKLLN